MPPEAITLRSSNWRSMSGIIMAWPHRWQGCVASGGRSPEIKTLLSQPLHVTIFSGALMNYRLASWTGSAGGSYGQNPVLKHVRLRRLRALGKNFFDTQTKIVLFTPRSK